MKNPTHEEILVEVLSITHNNFKDNIPSHNRENLDDLIADLIYYRDTLPTVDQYMEDNEL